MNTTKANKAVEPLEVEHLIGKEVIRDSFSFPEQGNNTMNDSWTIFIEVLSDEFTAKTGFGVYAHITPLDVDQAYQQFQSRNVQMRLFVRDYVRHCN